MAIEAFAAVMLGALLHATWNALLKAGRDKSADTLSVATGAALIALVVAPFLTLPAVASLPFMVASATIHVAYFLLIAAAYRASDMSYAYPLMRGTAPLLVAIASGPLIGERLGPVAWVGILLISGSIVGLTMTAPRGVHGHGRATAFALANAVVIACYTLVDGQGARVSGAPVAYTLWQEILAAVLLWACQAARGQLPPLVNLVERWRISLVGGGLALASYALALWAATRAPIATVSAAREVSILFGIAIGWFFLNERVVPARWLAAIGILAGVLTLRLA